MIHVASWTINDVWGRVTVKMPYKEKSNAEKLLSMLNEAGSDKPYFLTSIKEPISSLPARIVMVITGDRRINGRSEDKKTGIVKTWTKVLIDIETTTITEGNYILTETFTAHRYKGEIRVIVAGNSMLYEQFEEYAKNRWPTTYANLLIRLH